MSETTLERFFREASDAASWADPLTRRERTALARKLASAAHRFWDEAEARAAAQECIALHLDVTERAAVPAEETAR